MSKILLQDKTEKKTRTDFSTFLTENNTKTLYTSTENGTTVYYFAGNATDNWVKFGKNSSKENLYWRIIRTNADGSIRLLYHSTSTTAEDAYIGKSAFNSTSNDSKYVGYMYDSNETSSTIKTSIDKWYADNLYTNYGKYLSTKAIYCNDRTYTTSENNIYYSAYTRLHTNKAPTYDCSNADDKFTVSTSTGNGKLTYPIALMTADEISFAGGVFAIDAASYYYYNSAKESSTGSTFWYTMSPFRWLGTNSDLLGVRGSNNPGNLVYSNVAVAEGVRPVILLKSCVKWASGDGTADKPYTIDESYEC